MQLLVWGRRVNREGSTLSFEHQNYFAEAFFQVVLKAQLWGVDLRSWSSQSRESGRSWRTARRRQRGEGAAGG